MRQVVLCALAALVIVGCEEKKSSAPITVSPGPSWRTTGDQRPPPPPELTSDAGADLVLPAPSALATTMASAAASAQAQDAAVVDPDAAPLEDGRSQGARCFGAGAKGSRRTAQIKAYVMPSGSVSRAEVSAPGATEAELSCLRRVATGLRFAAKDVRTVEIDIEAVAP